MAAMGDFDNIFQTAAKIKGSQMEQMRRRFQSWPPYLQNTLFADEEARALRALPIDERLEAAAARRVRGNELFREGNYLGAYNEYQASLGAFIYCRSTDPDWKKKGIKDENLELVNDMGEAEQRDTVKAHVLRCYLNIAAATMHTGEHSICVRACDDALRQDAACVKALYRRARARIAPASAGGLEHEMALEDLKKAAEIDPADAMVTKELTRLRVTLKRQKARDKETFSGMFDRGAVVDEEEEDKLGGGAEARERERAKAQAMAAERQLQQMEAVARQFEAEGKTEQARELRDAIAKAKGSRPEKPQIDFLHPTEKMKKEALERGIDLDDPLVVAELVKLQQSKEFGGAATGTAADSSTAAVGGAGGSDAGAAAAGGRQPYENENGDIDVNKLPRELLITLLKDHATTAELTAMSDAEMRKRVQTLLDADKVAASNRELRAKRIQYVVIGLAAVFIIWRFYAVGVFEWLGLFGRSGPSEALDSGGHAGALDDEEDFFKWDDEEIDL